MAGDTNQRKVEHIDIIHRDPGVDRDRRCFDDYRLCHRALPEIDLAAVDTSCQFLGKRLRFPLLISSMTGGDHDRLRLINRNLAIAAEAAGVAMAVGSQRVMFTNPAAAASFALRQHAPSVPLLANIGAVQLNCGFGIDQCREAVAVLGADALCLHLNPLQEAVQPEGDTNFAGLAARITAVATGLQVPVILKEVGAGLSPRDVDAVLDGGIRHFDVAGTGGTSWSRIEHHRTADSDEIGLLFQDWGTPTPVALERLAPFGDRITLIASGGIRSGIDMVKAMVLGASLCGIAKPFLAAAEESPEAVVAIIDRLHRQFSVAMFLMGIDRIASLQGNRALISGGPHR